MITGIASRLGTDLARRLEREPWVDRIVGLDTRPPRARLERTEYIDADIRSPRLERIVPRTEVDTVVHHKIRSRPEPGTPASQVHDVNVIGSLQLLAACERAPTVQTIVVRGSAAIYGSEPEAPQFFSEEMSRLFPLRTRFQRDIAELEDYFQTFSHRQSDVTCTMLRYQPSVGPTMDSQVTRYLSLPMPPTYLGFDPRLQFVHEEDAVGALVAAIRNPVRGAVNVAAPGTIGLTRMLRMAGRPSLPVVGPLFGPVTRAAKRVGLADIEPGFARLLRYGRAVEVERLVNEVGYRPRYGAVEAVAAYLRREAAGERPAAADGRAAGAALA